MPSLYHKQTPSDLPDQVSDPIASPIPSDLQDDELSKKAGKWTTLEDDLLRKYVPVFGEKQWRKISEHIPGRTSIQCLHRWTKILKPGLVKGPWTVEEDQKLISWVKTEGPAKWAQCANLIKGRSGKQCRERWSNNLNPNVKKGNWTKEEDELIFGLYQKYGSSWSKVAKYIAGRTENAIKNRFYSTLRKLTLDKKKDQQESNEYLSIGEEGAEKIELSLKHPTDMGGPAQSPSTLYQLLNTKTNAILMEEEKAEIGVEDNKKQQQAFNINGEKIVVLRDLKPSQKKLKRETRSNDAKKNDAAFEVFLNSFEIDLRDDIDRKEEFSFFMKNNDFTDFDALQSKIKGYCQNNVKSLAEGFKTIDTSKASTSVSEVSASDTKSRSLMFPQRCVSAALPPSSRQQKSPTIKGNTIITPTPHKQSGFSAKAPQILNRTASSPLTSEFSPSGALNDCNIFQPRLFNGKINLEQNWPNFITSDFSHEFTRNQMVGMMLNPLSESEQKINCLFQQMCSLEVLLQKTRNNLLSFENRLKESEKILRPQNIRARESLINLLNPQEMLGGRPLWKADSEFEGILKKRKIE